MDTGDLIDQRFAIEREVAAGGMGRIFRAFDRHRGRPVALKLISLGDPASAERFVRESVLLAELRHPAIVEYVAHGEAGVGRLFLVMEWLDGEDLAQRLRSHAATTERTVLAKVVPGETTPGSTAAPTGPTGAPDSAAAPTAVYAGPPPPVDHAPMPPRPAHHQLAVADTVVLARRVASALAELHRRGIVHRDIKPSNLFLVGGAVGRTKVLDFGTARIAAEVSPITGDGVLVGTPFYMSPEQARGSNEIGPPTDVWALGCVVYECLTGRAPFSGMHPLAALARIVIDEPQPLALTRPDAPAELVDLIGRMLAKAPADRPADGAELLAELDDLPLVGAERLRASAADTVRSDVPAERAAAERADPRSVLTTSEARIAALLLARAPDGSPGDPRALAGLVARHGGGLEPLADGSGSILVTIAGLHAPKDQAARAARLALALRDARPELAQVLSTGRGHAGGQTPVGEVVDAAVAALLGAAPGEIHLDSATASLLEARFELDRDGERFRLARERRAEGARTLLGRPSRWVGRRRELAVLTSTFEECIEDRVARAVLVTAPAGIGKSRLRYELLRSLTRRREPLEVLYGQGDSLSAGSPFVMIGPALRRSAGILDGEPLASRRRKLLDRLARTVPADELDRTAALLGELVGVPFPDDHDEALAAARKDPMLLGDLMREAWQTWLRAETRRHAVLLVLEDLHWGDLPSVQYVDAALRALADRPLMVLALARPEVHTAFPQLWSQRELEEIRLHALSPRAAAELVRDALGDGATDEVVDALVARAEGNAFYLEELIRAVAERGATGSPDATTTATRAVLDALPATVLGMVQARLDSLDQQARRILRAASVFGEVFWEGGVRALLGDDAGAFDPREWLEDLAGRELITRRPDARLPDEREYRFRHALVRDGAYEMLTDDDRGLGHRLAGRWLVDAGEQDALVLAGHFERGDERAEAVRWYRRAADQALEGNDLGAVIERAERAVAAGAAGELLGGLRGLQSTAAYWQSDYTGALTYGRQAAALLPAGSAEWFKATGSALVASARLGDYTTVDALFDQVMRAPCQAGAETAQLVGLCRGAFQLIFHGRFARADEVLARIAALAATAPALDALTVAQVNHVQGVRAAHVGDVRTFLHHLEAAVAAFDRAGDTRNVSLERTTVAWCYAELGAFEHAEDLCRANMAFCERIGARQAVTYGRVNLGYILTYRDGKPAEARAELCQAIADCRAVGNPRLEGWARAHLTAVEHAAGNHRDEEEHARLAAELLAVSPGLQAWALATHARALLALGRVDEALAAARRAMPVLEELGGLLQGESLPPLVLAEALHAAGDVDAARGAITDAWRRLQRRADRLGRDDWRRSFLAMPDNARTADSYAAWVGSPAPGD